MGTGNPLQTDLLLPPLRLVAAIDGTNLKGSLENHGLTTHLNYRQFIIEIAKRIPVDRLPAPGKWALKSVCYVTAPPIQSHNPERYRRWRNFEAMLGRQERVRLRLGRLEGGRDRVYEKGVDILVAIELLAGAFKNEYDIAVIVAGDGDYADVAREVIGAGKTIVNAFFEQDKSYELANACNYFVPLHQLSWNKLRLAPPPGTRWSR